ncbi:outer dense fiber protein 2-like [Watersipora subatra]|uniref:outer dense fiber protein 2-like n=1 Tax=Watersipora subatra TaxID=2589382 RepID=UPI00355B8FBF
MSGKSSPLHVHVDDDTTVHVHVKKPKNLVGSRHSTESPFSSMRGQRSPGSTVMKSPSQVRVKSPKAPWVPAPGKTTKGNRVTFEGGRGTLELGGPYYDTMSRTELDEDRDTDTVAITAKARDYERKISGLMREVGGLRSEAEEAREAAELLDRSTEELRETRHDLWEKERENRRLRESMEDLRQDVAASRNSTRSLSQERERLLKKLVEAEMDGQEAARQVGSVKDLVRRLRTENKMTSEDLKLLTIQRENLTAKLTAFEDSNRVLRRLLQDQHASETEQQRLAEQKSILINKFAVCEEDNERLRQQIKDLEREGLDLKIQLRSQTDETMASATLQSSLEQTRAHLQRELRQREADCNRMAVQIRTLESDLAQEKIEVDHLQELLRQAHHKHEKDKESLKKATRIQKQRATKSESTVDELNLANMEKDQKLAELQAVHDEQRTLMHSTAREKASIQAENHGLKARLTEIEKLLAEAEDKQRQITDQSNSENHIKTQQIHQLKSELERTKTQMLTTEGKTASLEAECQALESDKREMEKAIREYRARSERGEQEADVLTRRLTETSTALDRAKMENSMEIERVRQRLEDRLSELEPLPELLKSTELRLHEANERLIAASKNSEERADQLAEYTAKVERHSIECDLWKEKYKTLETSIHAKVEALESATSDLGDSIFSTSLGQRLKDAETKNTELMISLSHKEEALSKANYKLEERDNENSTLARQLEASLADSRRLTEDVRDKSAYKERALQDRLRDMDEQLTNSRVEAAKARREKEELERKFNSKLYDLKDRLEQSHATNRSMQNYVQFLKSSYASVMGDVSVSSPISPVRASSTLRDGATSLRQPHF